SRKKNGPFEVPPRIKTHGMRNISSKKASFCGAKATAGLVMPSRQPLVNCKDFDDYSDMRNNFEFLDLKAFLAVLELSSFHGAARLLNISAPALTRRIKQLEQTVGAPLIERTTRKV